MYGRNLLLLLMGMLLVGPGRGQGLGPVAAPNQPGLAAPVLPPIAPPAASSS